MSIVGEILIGASGLISLVIAKTRIIFKGGGLSCSFNDHHTNLEHKSEEEQYQSSTSNNTTDELVERRTTMDSVATLPPPAPRMLRNRLY